jgi:hypothetical protein
MNAPSAPRKILVLLAGLVWTAVGLMLVLMAAGWFANSDGNRLLWLLAGIVGGFIVYRFGFGKLADENLVRIYAQAPTKDKVCVFAFQNTRSYFIVPIMILMGYTMRHLPIQKIYLIPIYITIGLGLILASLKCYGNLINKAK